MMKNSFHPLSLALLGAGLLSACGGGSDTGGTSSATGPITLSGIVAKGAALPNATVTAKCAAGTANPATTSSTGSYTITVTDGALPCVLEAVADNGALKLHSMAVAATSGATEATANITTLTELVVAQMVGTDPATFMASASTTALTSVATPARVEAAQKDVVTTLNGLGVDTSALASTNVMSGTLVAASSGTSGNNYDTVLDKLGTYLQTSGTTLATLTTSVATTASTSATALLPSELLTAPAASTCNALRSGTYRVVKLAPSSSTAATADVTTTELMTFDASTLKMTWSSDNSVDTLVASSEACRYTAANTGIGAISDIVVAPSGVMVARGAQDDGTFRTVLLFPSQTLSLADLAGTWNTMSWENPDNVATAWSRVGKMGTFVLGGDGGMTSAACFDDPVVAAATQCTTDTTLLPKFTANSAGGFDLVNTDPAEAAWKDRVFVFRAGNGARMLLALSPSGAFTVATQQRTLSLPAVGATSRSWNVYTDANGFDSALVDATEWQVVSVDTAGGLYTRNQWVTGSPNSYAVQTFLLNQSRTGYAWRGAATGTNGNGVGYTVRELRSMPLGMGVTVAFMPNWATSGNSLARYLFSVSRPAN